MPDPVLTMESISKSFGGNLVLDSVDLTLMPHEVHALVGENGAGKSTLMKILNGVYAMDSGAIRLNGQVVEITNPHDARRAGISMIFQEHTLARHLTVTQNVFLGIEPRSAFGILDESRMNRTVRELLAGHGFNLDPGEKVSRLTPAGKQMVEIARALLSATRVVVMDEPTSMLSAKESEELFRIIRDLRDRGLAIVYISHRMEELPQIADRITILRDGRKVFSGEFRSLDSHDIIRHMVGREIEELYPERGPVGKEVVLELREFGDGVACRNVSLQLHRGEILGVAGLVGAGRTAMAHAIFGLKKTVQGEMYLRGEKRRFRRSREAIRAGLAYLTEDRKATSLFPHLPLMHNISMAALEKVATGSVIRRTEEKRRCSRLIDELRIRARSGREPVYRLSGGNQQKAVVARWIFAGSDVILLDEPTQGVDLGARAEIYRLMQDIVRRGGSILLISSDLPELLGLSHRIAVMRRGEIVATLVAEQTTQEEIMRHAALVQ